MLGEKAYYKKCVKDSQSKISKEIMNNMDIKLDWKDIRRNQIVELKITSSTTLTANSTEPITYLIHYDYNSSSVVQSNYAE